MFTGTTLITFHTNTLMRTLAYICLMLCAALCLADAGTARALVLQRLAEKELSSGARRTAPSC